MALRIPLLRAVGPGFPVPPAWPAGTGGLVDQSSLLGSEFESGGQITLPPPSKTLQNEANKSDGISGCALSGLGGAGFVISA